MTTEYQRRHAARVRDVDREHDEWEADKAETERATAEYEAWLGRHPEGDVVRFAEGYDEPDSAYDPNDPDDNERLVPARESHATFEGWR